VDAYLEFGEDKIYIGRQDKNEFILTDVNASRLHAWIAYERHRHVLYDARSTNGTFVNDKLIDRVQLCHGDRVRVGSTLLKYEVI
jgi:pSer/pThr/pTyr-binding forkhead associated (FHA) protein